MAPCPHLLGLLLLLPPLPWQTSACEDLACFADYLETLTCTWESRRAIANLTGSWDCGLRDTCAFGPAGGGNGTRGRWTCFAEQTQCMGELSFRVEAVLGDPGPGDAPLRPCGKEFGFHDHVKPSPPFNLTAVASPDGYTLSWESRYRSTDFLDGELEYELGYRRRGHPWPEPSQKRLLQDTRTLQLLPQELEAGTEYELRVRARPRESSLYRGTWSDWSPPAILETLPMTSGASESRGLLLLLLLLSFLPALLGVLGWRQRLWKKLDRFVPSPAPFFQPLFLVHKGDFKKWVGASSAGAVLDVSEWGAVVPEVCQKIDIKFLPPPSPPKGGSGWRDGRAAVPMAVPPSSQLIPADSHHVDEQEEPTASEQPYGHLSIDMVMVAGGLAHCCPECGSAGLCGAPEQQDEEKKVEAAEGDAYGGFHPEGTNSSQSAEHFFSGAGGTPLPCCSASPVDSPLWEATPALVQAGGFLGRRVVNGGEPFGLGPGPCRTLWVGTPLGLSSPQAEETAFCRELLSPEMDAEGNPGNGLDLDTIDSGFADCECGSPVDIKCQGRQVGRDSVGAVEEKEAFLASYVKQWVSSH